MFRSLILIPSALLTMGSWAQFGPEQIIASKDFKDASGINAIDVDNDGLIDLVVCEGVYGDDRILWYKNLGGGNFDWKRTISTAAPYPTRLVAADVDNDGTQDLICAPYSNGSFFWFKNNGDQPWPDQSFGQILYPSGILEWAVGDLDMDSDQDVVFTMKRTQSQQETIVVGRCVNDGAGNFSATDTLLLFAPFDSLSILRKMAIVDMDQDGINDILFVGGGFSWLEGTGSGTFGARHELPLSAPYATTLKVEDVTGDGIPDILVSSYSSTLSLSQFNIYQNDGTGSLSSIYYSSGLPELQNIGLSDMNGDGTKDLLLAYRGNFGEFGGKSIWRTIQTTPSFAVSSTYEVMSPIGNFKGSDWADLDNNGMVDVAFAMEEDVRWFEQTQQDTVIAHHISSLGYHDVQMAEINGDGIPDLVSGGTAMYPGQGGGQFGPQQWLRDRPYFQYYAMADFDSDGDTDMVWSENGLGKVMLNDGQGHFTWACDLLHTYSDDDYMLPTIADIDGDGDPDIVFAMNYLGSTIAWYANLGGGQFSPPHILVAYDPFERAHFMEAADLDGDGDVDIGCRMTTTVGKFYIVRNQGQGVFSPPEVVCDLPTVCYTDMGDIDGDSDLDLVWSDTANGLVHVLLNDGAGHFTEHQVFPLQGPRSTTLSDLDGDGRAELIIVSSTFGGLVYRMDVDDMFTLWVDILVPLNSISNYVDHIVPSDVDGDGDIDLLLGRNGLHRISWLDQADCNAFEANVSWAGTDSLQATAGIHYQWFLNGDSIPGATGQSTVTTTPGEYMAVVTDDHGCVDASEPYNVITLAVNELNTPAFTVAPNPASQDLWITSSRTLDGEMRIDIFDMSGRVVSSTTRNSEQLIHLERGSIRSGIYWVRLSDAESVIGIALVVFE